MTVTGFQVLNFLLSPLLSLLAKERERYCRIYPIVCSSTSIFE